MNTITNTPDTMTTLSASTNQATLDGYTESFKVEGKGLTGAATADKKFYSPAEVKIDNFYRFEGYSNPEDNVILYLIQTTDGRKGTLIDAYGAYADIELSEFIKEVEQMVKKDNGENKE